ncbi:hypothetical protein F4560_002042 [Saccharothrix ecbatanensis]|uniref:Uncharacterized protein n=1 Tax=Saccharothrix ecbatanensis TaxID=1105145 RepID=A0A7W9LZU0_9PSEU|nr:hypothetical protein [Saccharothrix ecbatanensis]MBB5802274.1 hypothetical protein [Saccharothrix ecbatanensis]
MADDEREIRVPEVDTTAQEEQLADTQRKIDEAKVAAADLARTTPDPLPDSEPPERSTPAS